MRLVLAISTAFTAVAALFITAVWTTDPRWASTAWILIALIGVITAVFTYPRGDA